MNIRICNLVIRFDKPKTFRPYVQSRGRARAKESNYILLCTNQEKQDFKSEIGGYITIENYFLMDRYDVQTVNSITVTKQ